MPPPPAPPQPEPRGSSTGIVIAAVLAVIVLLGVGAFVWYAIGDGAFEPEEEVVAYPQSYETSVAPFPGQSFPPGPVDDPCSLVDRARYEVLLPNSSHTPGANCDLVFEHGNYDETGHIARLSISAQAFDTVDYAIGSFEDDREYWAHDEELGTDGLQVEAFAVGYGTDSSRAVTVVARSENLVVKTNLTVEDLVDGEAQPNVPHEVLRAMCVDAINEVMAGLAGS
ncbi:hypothetical protein STSO111631_22880 [Stackebrandtia soli]